MIVNQLHSRALVRVEIRVGTGTSGSVFESYPLRPLSTATAEPRSKGAARVFAPPSPTGGETLTRNSLWSRRRMESNDWPSTLPAAFPSRSRNLNRGGWMRSAGARRPIAPAAAAWTRRSTPAKA